MPNLDQVAVVVLVQSLNSPFFPPHIGAEPGRAKEESRITCMRMLRTPPFFPPNRGKNHIWKYSPDLTCGAIFWIIMYKQQFLHLDWLKTCQLIPNQWNFTSATLYHIQFVFYHNIKDNERNLWQDFVDNWKQRLGLESARAALCKWATCTRQTSLSKTFAKSLNIQKKYKNNVSEKSNDAFWLSIRVHTMIIKPYLRFYRVFFYDNINIKENVFFQNASWKRHCAAHWRERRGWSLVIFDWFVLSMCMQVILGCLPFTKAIRLEISGINIKQLNARLWERESL